jgi:hypothetical protein
MDNKDGKKICQPQDKYNIGVLTVNIEFIWLGTKQMERLAKAYLSPFLSLAT